MKTLHKDRILAALIIFAIVLFISGEYTISTTLFAILVIFLNIKISRNRFKAEELSCD
jgi:predicted membrane protein